MPLRVLRGSIFPAEMGENEIVEARESRVREICCFHRGGHILKLTQRQEQLLLYIRSYQEKLGITSTIREICSHFGLKGPAGIHRILHVLVEKGYLFAISKVLPTVPRIRLSCIFCTWFPLRRSEDRGHSIRWVTFHPVLDKTLW